MEKYCLYQKVLKIIEKSLIPYTQWLYSLIGIAMLVLNENMNLRYLLCYGLVLLYLIFYTLNLVCTNFTFLVLTFLVILFLQQKT